MAKRHAYQKEAMRRRRADPVRAARDKERQAELKRLKASGEYVQTKFPVRRMDHTTGKKLDPTVPQSVPVLTRKLEEAIVPTGRRFLLPSIPKQPPTSNFSRKVPSDSPYLISKSTAKLQAAPAEKVTEEEVIDDEVVHEE
jgi:hypothetical protein